MWRVGDQRSLPSERGPRCQWSVPGGAPSYVKICSGYRGNGPVRAGWWGRHPGRTEELDRCTWHGAHHHQWRDGIWRARCHPGGKEIRKGQEIKKCFAVIVKEGVMLLSCFARNTHQPEMLNRLIDWSIDWSIGFVDWSVMVRLIDWLFVYLFVTAWGYRQV